MPAPDETCGTCRFFKRNPDGVADRCRRYPPVLIGVTGSMWTDRHDAVGGETESYTGQPAVDDDDWCGEYQPNPEAMWALLANLKRKDEP